MPNIQSVKCVKCDVPLKGPASPQPQDRFACPVCGEGDTLEQIKKELAEQFADKAGDLLHRKLAEALRGSKTMKLKSSPRSPKTYRFVLDVESHS